MGLLSTLGLKPLKSPGPRRAKREVGKLADGSLAASTEGAFVPDLETSGAFQRTIAVGESATLRLKVRNWASAPKGVVFYWGASVSGNAVDVDIEHHGGEGIVTVRGLSAGEGVVHADVKVGAGAAGSTYTFSDTTFAVQRSAQTIDSKSTGADPAGSADEGGIASITDLEQDMRDILQDWKGAAADGVQQFATAALSDRIDDLESGSATALFAALLGNTVWAAAAFTTGGAAFAISMVGVATAALPTVPHKGKSFIPDIQKAMVRQIYTVYGQLDKGLRSNAQALVSSHPGITRFRAMTVFVAASFQPWLYIVDAKYGTIPTLNMSAIRDLYALKATQGLDAAIKAEFRSNLIKRPSHWGSP